jgi:hypothetical protein
MRNQISKYRKDLFGKRENFEELALASPPDIFCQVLWRERLQKTKLCMNMMQVNVPLESEEFFLWKLSLVKESSNTTFPKQRLKGKFYVLRKIVNIMFNLSSWTLTP